MEFATKYALIPEEDFTKHVPSKKQMTDFDIAMAKILNSSLPDHEKVQRYYELLKRKMDLQEFNIPWKPKMEESHETKLEENPVKQEPNEDYDSFVLSSVPSSMKKQAENLLNYLKKHPDIIEWDKKGIISFHRQKVEQSNLADLFHLIFCVNKKPPVPAQNEFLQVLREIGIPSSTIKNKHLKSESKIVHVESSRRNFVKQKKRSNRKKTHNLLQNGGFWESF